MWPAGRTFPDIGNKLCTFLCFSSYLIESGKNIKEKECNFISMKKLFDKNCQSIETWMLEVSVAQVKCV